MESPTNGELALMIQSQGKEASDANLGLVAAIARVEAKVDYTNGRVRKLEAWKFITIGAVAVLNLIVVPLVVQYLVKLTH